jgi:methionyl-tRNA formyltransferase
VKELAQESGIEVFQPQKLKDPEVIPWLEKHSPEVIVVVAYGGFVPKAVREFPNYGCVNLHPSLLPKYRGAAPMQWALMNGDTLTGNTTMYLSAGWDDGDMIFQEEEEIDPNDDYGSLSARLAEKGGRLIVKTLLAIQDGTAPRVPQPEEGVVMAPMISNEQCRIDWSKPCREIYNQVRGLNPVPGAYTMHHGKRWKIRKVDFFPDKDVNAEPGTILTTDFNTIRVAAGDGMIEILELQPEGKKPMSAVEFLRGNRELSGTLI